ncbi:MAG: hypothetical protein U0798_07825 [Gemmataceae bacterium]
MQEGKECEISQKNYPNCPDDLFARDSLLGAQKSAWIKNHWHFGIRKASIPRHIRNKMAGKPLSTKDKVK